MFYLIVVAFALLGLASASVEVDSPCRLSEVSPRVKTGFVLDAYLGRWYEERRYENLNQTDFDCVTAEYTLNNDGSIRVNNSGYNPGGFFIETVGRAVPSFPEQDPLPAKLDLVFVEGMPPAIYWVLSTDYVNYAVVWSCVGLANNRSREQAWVLSRSTQLSSESTTRVNQVIAENNLVPGVFRVTGQDLTLCRNPIPI